MNSPPRASHDPFDLLLFLVDTKNICSRQFRHLGDATALDQREDPLFDQRVSAILFFGGSAAP
jgi:hypothetical protein